MAKQHFAVYLGYEGEIIMANDCNYTINKIGGLPDWPPHKNINLQLKCPLCGLYRLLITQCYVPLETSTYHRTFYVFACINPNCWIQSESWLCVRTQVEANLHSQSDPLVEVPKTDKMVWCNGADEWDDNDNGNMTNENSMKVDNVLSSIESYRDSDNEDESNSFEVDTMEQALGNLHVFDVHNANISPVQGAMGAIKMPSADAELEDGDEPGLVIVDTPTVPTSDIQALLHQTGELPRELRSRLITGPLQFEAKYIYVEAESGKVSDNDRQVAELLKKYTEENEIEVSGGFGQCNAGDSIEDEYYEDSTPLHGDKLFHNFLTRLRQNPGQILRYTRDERPLLGAPLPTLATSPESPSAPIKCVRCNSKLICELQLVPEFAETLQLKTSGTTLSHLHFLSVLIFTCSQSCWQPNDLYVMETVIFQPEVV